MVKMVLSQCYSKLCRTHQTRYNDSSHGITCPLILICQVIKYDLQLLAQISSSSDDIYFKAFLINLLQLFSTDRRLLETRGSLIIRQLCLTLRTERILRTFAEILEKEEASNTSV